MAHASWKDIIFFAIAGFVAVGVYGLISSTGQETIGTWSAMITLIGVWILEYFLCGSIKNKVTGTKKFSYTKAQVKPQVQKRISFDEFKYCIKCGSEMKKDLKICTKCGQPFQV